jgi:hypothetical protein
MSVLGPYVFTDCSERKTEARTTVGYVMYQQQANRAKLKTCLRLPYRQCRPSESSKHVTAPRHPNGNNVAVYIVLYQLV